MTGEGVPWPSKPKVTVRYTCGMCHVVDRDVTVPARTADQDVVYWAQQVMAPALGADHMRVSSLCRAARMKHVKVPLGKDGSVGGVE